LPLLTGSIAGHGEYGEWKRKGAVLSDVTAQKEHGPTHDFIVRLFRIGKFGYRGGAPSVADPYLRVFTSELEVYIVEKLGADLCESETAAAGCNSPRKPTIDSRCGICA
jgi:hypothetical protein